MIVISVDVGLKGGFAILKSKIEIDAKYVMPIINGKLNFVGIDLILKCARALADINKTKQPLVGVIEQVSAMPGQGVTSMFTFGRNYGAVEQAFFRYCDNVIYTRPKAWQAISCKGTKGTDPKKRALEAASNLFPKENFLATARSKVPHQGLVDSVLIAHAGFELCK